jgi:guanine nucleotide-binding protein G(i) subunit alpha
MHVLLESLTILNISFTDETVAKPAYELIMATSVQVETETLGKELTEAVQVLWRDEAVQVLWRDEGVQKAFTRKNELQLNDSGGSLFSLSLSLSLFLSVPRSPSGTSADCLD